MPQSLRCTLWCRDCRPGMTLHRLKGRNSFLTEVREVSGDRRVRCSTHSPTLEVPSYRHLFHIYASGFIGWCRLVVCSRRALYTSASCRRASDSSRRRCTADCRRATHRGPGRRPPCHSPPPDTACRLRAPCKTCRLVLTWYSSPAGTACRRRAPVITSRPHTNVRGLTEGSCLLLKPDQLTREVPLMRWDWASRLAMAAARR